MSKLTLPEAFKIIQGHEPEAVSTLLSTADIISCKNFKKVWAVVSLAYVDDVDVVATWNESTDVAGTGTAAISAVCPIWYNVDISASDLMTRATDAATFTMDTGAGKDQLWIMEWDPAKFSAGFDCFQLRLTGAAASIASIVYIGEPRYQSDVNVAAITD